MAKYEEIRGKGLNNAYTWNGGIGNKQLKWLTKVLRRADTFNKKVVILCHWPLLPENGTQLWKLPDEVIIDTSENKILQK